MSYLIPVELRHLEARSDGRAWLDSLDGLIAAACERWSLQVDEPFAGSHASWTAPALRADGTSVVLKVPFPHREATCEAAALQAWDGNGAARLWDYDTESGDMVMEQLLPGAHLSTIGNEAALDVYIDLLPRLWVDAGEPFSLASDEATRWAGSAVKRWERSGQLYDKRLVDAATMLLSEAGSTAAQSADLVLVHQDMHANNIVSATREPWLVIDLKPLLGPKELSLAPIVRSTELGHSKTLVLRRFDRLVEALELNVELARAWTIGQTVAWAAGPGGVVDSHIETATWLLDLR